MVLRPLQIEFFRNLLEGAEDCNQRLVFADVGKRTIKSLPSPAEDIKNFDISDQNHYVYGVGDQVTLKESQIEGERSAIVGTGRWFSDLLFPSSCSGSSSDLSYLWAVVDGKRFEVKKDGTPLANFGSFALSPDGNSLVTTLPVLDVPSTWEMLYPPPPSTISKSRIQAGKYDAKSSHIHQYVRIDLQTGSIQSLTNAPLGNDAGWIASGDPSWSDDGREILVPNTFLKSKGNAPSRPCVAVVEVSSGASTCVEVLKAHKTETIVEEGYHVIYGARFAGGGTSRVMVVFMSHEDQSFRTTEYERMNDIWQAVREMKGSFPAEHNGLEVNVKQGLNDPPVLVATNKRTSQIIWDPNPQLKSIELGQASVYTWKDKEGRDWRGGLYKPSPYNSAQRYPLVIQTHGFTESEFRPSGVFPTAFAARELAAKGIMVLQTATPCPLSTAMEGPCAVSGYEAAVRQLVSEGLVDPERIGIIGFSRTCFHVMDMLTFGGIRLKAASITDGGMVDYFQYLLVAGEGPSIAFETMIGASPFGEGLELWMKRSPGFNLDKITTPLLVVGEGPSSVLTMWQPYAGLRRLKKPVELIKLNTDEHVLTNPAVRMASQGGSVDWFSFWLKGEEDIDPAKVDQYARWHELQKSQEQEK